MPARLPSSLSSPVSPPHTCWTPRAWWLGSALSITLVLGGCSGEAEETPLGGETRTEDTPPTGGAASTESPTGNTGGPSAATVLDPGDNPSAPLTLNPRSPVCRPSGASARPGWRLVWCDEFEGTDIDTTRWNFDLFDGAFLPSGPGWGNQEKEFYTARSANAHVENGKLFITALKDGPHHANGPSYPSTYEYSSARLNTKGKADFTYGRIEVRAKLPEGQGVWPAIWMLPTDNAYGGWASSGEIDIMEARGQAPSSVLGTLHYGNMWNKNAFVGCTFESATKFSSDFHTFAVEWTPESIQWFVDDVRFGSQSPRGAPKAAPVCTNAAGASTAPNVNENVLSPEEGWYSVAADAPAPFNRRFHLILNVAVGGGFVGAVDAAAFPQSLQVEYVRVYQR